jgi:hypothetical protein
MYILAPFRVPPERPRTTPAPATRLREARPSSALAASQPVPATVPQAITQTAPPPDPLALPAKPDEDLRQRALKSAAAVDKQLRKEAWNPRDKFVANDQTALAAKLGGAYIGGGSVTYEEVTLADGRRMTKIHGPAGTYCAYMESNALTGGRDPFRDGVKTKVGTCPM